MPTDIMIVLCMPMSSPSPRISTPAAANFPARKQARSVILSSRNAASGSSVAISTIKLSMRRRYQAVSQIVHSAQTKTASSRA